MRIISCEPIHAIDANAVRGGKLGDHMMRLLKQKILPNRFPRIQDYIVEPVRVTDPFALIAQHSTRDLIMDKVIWISPEICIVYSFARRCGLLNVVSAFRSHKIIEGMETPRFR